MTPFLSSFYMKSGKKFNYIFSLLITEKELIWVIAMENKGQEERNIVTDKAILSLYKIKEKYSAKS